MVLQQVQGNVNRFASDHDVVFWYRKGDKYTFNPQQEVRDKAIRQRRVWDKGKGRIVNAKGKDGKVLYQESAASNHRRCLADFYATTRRPNPRTFDFQLKSRRRSSSGLSGLPPMGS